MQITITIGRDPGTIIVTIGSADRGLPSSMRVAPDGDERPFHTSPTGHRFEASIGEFGPPREMIQVARDYLSHRISLGTAEMHFARLLARWARTADARSSP
jgi:hypothetical protein